VEGMNKSKLKTKGGFKMKQELWNEIIKEYGTQCEPYKDLIELRLAAMLTATLYAGETGDNPLCELNRSLNKVVYSKC